MMLNRCIYIFFFIKQVGHVVTVDIWRVLVLNGMIVFDCIPCIHQLHLLSGVGVFLLVMPTLVDAQITRGGTRVFALAALVRFFLGMPASVNLELSRPCLT